MTILRPHSFTASQVDEALPLLPPLACSAAIISDHFCCWRQKEGSISAFSRAYRILE